MLGCNEFMVVGILSNIAQSYHVTLSSIGILVTVFALVYAISTPVLTTMTSHWNRRKLLLVLIAIFFVSNTMTAMAPTLGWLFAARIMTALVAGTIITLVNLFASIVTPMDKRPMVMAWVGAGFSIASVVGVPIGSAIAAWISWHASFWMVSGLTLVVFAMLVWLLPDEKPEVTGSIVEQLSLLKDHKVLLGIGITIAVMAVQYTFYTYIRSIITSVLGYNITTLNWLLLMLGVMSIIGNQIAGMVAKNNGFKKLPYVFSLLIIFCLLLGVALKSSILGIVVLAILCTLVIIYGTTIQLGFMDEALKNYPQSLALATSLISIFANVGISLGSLSASTTVRFLSLNSVGYIAAIYAVVALLLSLKLRQKTKNDFN
ncbi:MFS transporter [Companilactobacillus ginsenosidimutans]|uniref:MFS transporter n=2 Tax=Companilactobacillus ginsenosidimutans TaxID=1007676 RepID=A0A0H4QKQ0_9LACO|nr:MFS transporter [Companilactobacillus ginsenosidimutans]